MKEINSAYVRLQKGEDSDDDEDDDFFPTGPWSMPDELMALLCDSMSTGDKLMDTFSANFRRLSLLQHGKHELPACVTQRIVLQAIKQRHQTALFGLRSRQWESQLSRVLFVAQRWPEMHPLGSPMTR